MGHSGAADGDQAKSTRRSVLAGSAAGLTGSGLLAIASSAGFAQASDSAGRSAPATGISPRDLGAIGDGQFRPLSDRFSTLAQAQAHYPFAERLDQSLDWAGIQAALDIAEPVGGTVVIPTGRFIITDTLRIPSGITVQGESRNGSVIDNQNYPLAAPQLANKDPVAFLYVTIRDLTLHGGTHALRVEVSREVAGIVLDGLSTALQSEANIDFSSLQTAVLRDCALMGGRFGLTVRGFPCNSVHLINTRIGGHSDASIRLRGVDGFVMLGGSIEAGITPGKATIDIATGGAYAQAIDFQNVYFENTHTVLLRSRGTNAVVFGKCKFTGTGGGEDGRPGPYSFDCGEDVIAFDTNFFHVPMTGPDNMLMVGNNVGLKAGGTVWRQRDASHAILTSRRFALDQARGGLFTISLQGAGGRVVGTLELMADPGAGRPLQRTRIPLDIVMKAGTDMPDVGDLTAGLLAVTRDGEGVRVRLNDMPGGDNGTQDIWFTLDLTHPGPAAMDVRVL